MARSAQFGSSVVHGIRSSGMLCALLLVVLSFAPAASANTTLFGDDRICGAQNCAALSQFGLLVGTTSDLLTLTADWNISSGIAIGTSSNFNRGAGANTASGPIDFADAVVYNSTNCNATGSTNYCGAGTLSGTTPSNTNATRVNDAQSQLDAILTVLGGGGFNTGNGTTTALPTSGTQNITTGLSGGTMKIYRNTSAYTTSGTLTLGCGSVTCDANMLVVIHITGGNTSINHNLVLNDGLTPDQVVFYIPSNNLNITPTAAATTVRGSFIVGTGAATIAGTTGASDPVSMYGRVYVNDGNITVNDRGTSAQQIWSDPGPIVTPEPGTWAMMAGGFAAFVWQLRRRKRAAASDGK